MNLRDLQYLVALDDHHHFGKAAAASFVSQPALSMQIKKLEESLGVTLIERSNRHVMLTPIGKDIAVRARDILRQAEEIKTLARSQQDPYAGNLRLGAFPTLAPFLFPRVIPRIHQKFPKLKLLLMEEKTQDLLDRLARGEVDTALLARPIEDERLESLTLFEEPFYLAVNESHPWAKRKSIAQHDLESEQLLLLEEGHCLRGQALDFCGQAGAIEMMDFRATSMETLRQMVVAGVGITLVPALAVPEGGGAHEGVCYIPFTKPKPQRVIALFWRKTSPRSNVIRMIGEEIKTHLSK